MSFGWRGQDVHRHVFFKKTYPYLPQRVKKTLLCVFALPKQLRDALPPPRGRKRHCKLLSVSCITYLCLHLIIYKVPRPLGPTGAKLKVFRGPLGGAGGPSLGRGPMVKNHCPKGQPDKAIKAYVILDDNSNRSLARSSFFELFNIDCKPYY